MSASFTLLRLKKRKVYKIPTLVKSLGVIQNIMRYFFAIFSLKLFFVIVAFHDYFGQCREFCCFYCLRFCLEVLLLKVIYSLKLICPLVLATGLFVSFISNLLRGITVTKTFGHLVHSQGCCSTLLRMD